MKKKRVLLISFNMPGDYCLALYYLKLYALKNAFIKENYEIKILEINVKKNIYKILFKIIKTNSHLYAFSGNIWNIKKTLIIARMLKFLTNKTIFLGGEELTNSAHNYLINNSFIDIIVDGEGEETFSELLISLAKTNLSNLDTIDGIHYRQGKTTFQNKRRKVIENLDIIPSPYLTFEYHVSNASHYGMMLEYTRGCPHCCSFCFEGKKYARSRTFSIERIRQEITLGKHLGIRRFHFIDPIIGNGNDSSLKLISEVIKNIFPESTDYFIPVEVYAEFINSGNISFLDVFSAFDVGLQTINQQVQKNCNRNFHLDKFLDGYLLLQTLHKEIVLYILIGLPGDNFYSLMKTIKFVVFLRPTFFYTNHLFVLNGTLLRDQVSEYNIEFNPEPPYEIISNNTFSRRELLISRRIAEMNMKMYNLSRSLYSKIDQFDRICSSNL